MESIILNIIIVLGVIFVSMTIHEFMHGFIAYKLGDDTPKDEGRLTLNPIKHIDPFLTILLPVFLVILGGPIFGGAKPVPFNPSRVKGDEWGVALVALSGPLVNLFLALIAFGLLYFLPPMEIGSISAMILTLFLQINLGFFIFNMLPIPPLDGSRLLYALAPDFIRNVMMQIESLGLILVFLIVFMGSGLIGTIIRSVSNFIIGVFDSLFAIFSVLVI